MKIERISNYYGYFTKYTLEGINWKWFTYFSTMLAIILYWIHCRAFEAEYNVNIANTIHRLPYTRYSPVGMVEINKIWVLLLFYGFVGFGGRKIRSFSAFLARNRLKGSISRAGQKVLCGWPAKKSPAASWEIAIGQPETPLWPAKMPPVRNAEKPTVRSKKKTWKLMQNVTLCLSLHIDIRVFWLDEIAGLAGRKGWVRWC